MSSIRFQESRSFLLQAEQGAPHELYPPVLNARPTLRVDLYEPEAVSYTHLTLPTIYSV